MQASARLSKSDRERLPGNDAAKHRRSIRTISSAIAGWLLVKIRLGSLYGVGDSPIKSSNAQADVPPMSAFGRKRTSAFALHMSANDPKRTLSVRTSNFFGNKNSLTALA